MESADKMDSKPQTESSEHIDKNSDALLDEISNQMNEDMSPDKKREC